MRRARTSARCARNASRPQSYPGSPQVHAPRDLQRKAIRQVRGSRGHELRRFALRFIHSHSDAPGVARNEFLGNDFR